ncbi:YcjF family protein [Rhodovibrionaceae bacterium A322]
MSTVENTADQADAPESLVDAEAHRLAEAQSMVRRLSAWSFGAGCIPVPVLDMATVTGVQLNMINKLSKLYGHSFSEHTAKNIITALLGSIVPNVLTWGSVGSAIKAIPVIGAPLALLTMPSFSAAATYAIGRVYIQHLEAGGTLLDFNPEEMKAHFRAEFEKEMERNKASGKKGGAKAA